MVVEYSRNMEIKSALQLKSLSWGDKKNECNSNRQTFDNLLWILSWLYFPTDLEN